MPGEKKYGEAGASPDAHREDEREALARLEAEIKTVVIGHDRAIRQVVTAFAAGGHVLLEGVPGIAKTLLGKTIADCSGCTYNRVQFTPDLLPADITGTKIYRFETSAFETVKGPVFANIVLADEINRAPPKVQSALLEAMQENQVTIQGDSYAIDPPFFVIATQNPIESEGTYPLPEAQTDRFMLKVLMDYPSKEEELRIIDRFTGQRDPAPCTVLTRDAVRAIRQAVRTIPCSDLVREYAATIVDATRHPDAYGIAMKDYIAYGASPRATISLILCARARSLMEGRDYVIPDDIREMAHPALRHRIILNYEAEADGVDTDAVIDACLSRVTVP